MISIGNENNTAKELKKAYIGNKEVKKIFLGTKQIFPKLGPHGEHTDNDWVKRTDNNPIWASDFQVDKLGHIVEAEVMLEYDTSSNYDWNLYSCWGDNSLNNAQRDYMWLTKPRYMIELAFGERYPEIGLGSLTASEYYPNNRITYYCECMRNGRIILKINGTTRINGSADSSYGGNLSNFSIGYSSNGTVKTRVYSLKYYDHNRTLIKDLIPAINPDGVYGLWCRVSQKFYSAGSTAVGSTNYHPLG